MTTSATILALVTPTFEALGGYEDALARELSAASWPLSQTSPTAPRSAGRADKEDDVQERIDETLKSTSLFVA